MAIAALIGLALGAATGDAQTRASRAATPHLAYSRHILRHADSVARFAQVETKLVTGILQAALKAAEAGGDEDSVFDAGATIAAALASAMRRKAGDFDAVTPGVAFERVHQQIVKALEGMAGHGRGISDNLAFLSCSQARRTGDSCFGPLIRQRRISLLVQSVNALSQALQDYVDARRRAKGLLAERAVTLPALQSDSSDATTYPGKSP